MHHIERTELIAALVQLTRGSEQVLSLAERLLGIPGTPVGLSASELANARSQIALWRKQFDVLRNRVASLTIQPPNRPQ